MKRFIIYGETIESESNLVILSINEARNESDAFQEWKESEMYESQRKLLTDTTIRVIEIGSQIKYYDINSIEDFKKV